MSGMPDCRLQPAAGGGWAGAPATGSTTGHKYDEQLLRGGSRYARHSGLAPSQGGGGGAVPIELETMVPPPTPVADEPSRPLEGAPHCLPGQTPPLPIGMCHQPGGQLVQPLCVMVGRGGPLQVAHVESQATTTAAARPEGKGWHAAEGGGGQTRSRAASPSHWLLRAGEARKHAGAGWWRGGIASSSKARRTAAAHGEPGAK